MPLEIQLQKGTSAQGTGAVIVKLNGSLDTATAPDLEKQLAPVLGAPTKDIWFYEHRVPDGQKAYSMTKPIRLEHFQGCIAWWGGKERKGREETPQAWRVSAEEVQARGYNLDIKNPHSVADDHGDPETQLADLANAEAETAGLRDQLKTILAEALAR